MDKTVKHAFAALAVCGLVASASPIEAQAAAHVLRFATTNVEGNPQHDGLVKFAELVNAKSDGKMTVKVFSGGTLGKDIQVLSSMQGGTIDGAAMGTNLLVGIAKDAGLVDLPYLFDNEQEAYAVLDGPFGQKLYAELEPKGLVGLAYFDMGFYGLHNGKHPISRVEDVKGLKMRVTETPVIIDTFKAWGAAAVPLPYTELYTALESRIVDGGGQPPINMIYAKIREVSRYYTLNRYAYMPASLLMSKKTLDRLTVDEKTVVMDAAREASAYQRQVAAGKSAECLADLEKSKTNEVITDLPLAEMARFRDAVRPVVDKYLKIYDEQLGRLLFDEIAKYRAGKK